MYIQKEDIKRKLKNAERENSLVEFISLNNAGRRKGDKEITDEQRESIGLLSNLIGSRKTAEIMDCSQSTAANAANGFIGTGDNRHIDKDLKEKIEEQEEKIETVILNKTLAALGVISQEKLEELDPVKAAIVAEKVSSISTRRGNGKIGAIYAPIIHVPAVKDRDHYEVIEVKAVPIL